MQPTAANPMEGKTCVVTGATSGLGLVTARELARQGAHVVIHGRNPAKTAAAVADLRSATGNPKIESVLADMSSLRQVRDLAGQILDKYPRLDVLVNNAGGAWRLRALTVDGHEMTVAVNHLSCFLLTTLLQGRLESNPQARIVNVSSEAHRFGSIDWDDLMAQRRYGGYRQYARSKLMNLMFTYELARRLDGTGVTANAVHPGVVATGIASNYGWRGKIWDLLAKVVAVGPEKGARTQIFLATSPEVAGVTGTYFAKQRPIASSKASYDEEAAKRLWQVSLELTAAKNF
jgi:NAD(P)-dependent dehydrogenase (short-subunit alcohol dehydrogenase family)